MSKMQVKPRKEFVKYEGKLYSKYPCENCIGGTLYPDWDIVDKKWVWKCIACAHVWQNNSKNRKKSRKNNPSHEGNVGK